MLSADMVFKIISGDEIKLLDDVKIEKKEKQIKEDFESAVSGASIKDL